MIYKTDYDYEETRHGLRITIYMPQEVRDMWERGELLYNLNYIGGDGGDWDFYVDDGNHFALRSKVEACDDFEETEDGWFEDEYGDFALVSPEHTYFDDPELVRGWWEMTMEE